MISYQDVDYFLYMDMVNNGRGELEESDGIKWLTFPRRNPIIDTLDPSAPYGFVPQQFVKDPDQYYDTVSKLSLNHENEFIWQIILSPSNHDDRKVYKFEKRTPCKDFNNKCIVNTEYLRFYKFTERMDFNVGTIRHVYDLAQEEGFKEL